MTLLSIKFSFWMSRASDASWSPRDKERVRRNVLQLRVSKWPQGGHEDLDTEAWYEPCSSLYILDSEVLAWESWQALRKFSQTSAL